MSMTSKANAHGYRERRGGLNPSRGSSLRGLLALALSGLFAASAFAANLTGPGNVTPARQPDNTPTPDDEIPRLTTKNVKFTWNRGSLNNGNQVNFELLVGTREAFGDITKSDVINAVKDKANYDTTLILPTNGSKLYVRLIYRLKVAGGAVVARSKDYVYFAANKHYVASPVPTSALMLQDIDGCKAAPETTFRWEVVAAQGEPDRWWFYLGNAADSDAFYNSGQISKDQRSTTVRNIPTKGEPVIATLWWEKGDGDNWKKNEYPYSTPTLPAISSPMPGSRLSGTSGSFVLDPNGLAVQYWWLYVGTERQKFDLYSNGQEIPAEDRGTTSMASFDNFPDDGSDVFATLWWRFEGEGPAMWKCREFSYRASTGPAITAPASDVKLPEDLAEPGNSQTVMWDDKGTRAVKWQLVLNESGDPNDDGVWKSGDLGADVREATIPNSKFTTDGRTVYVVLRYWVGRADNVFTGSVVGAFATRKVPYLTAPSSIVKDFTSSLGNEANFGWASGNFDGLLGYWLYVGKSQGSREYHNSSDLSPEVLSRSLDNLPTDGQPLWVRLWWLVEETTTVTEGDNDPGGGDQIVETTTKTWLKRDFQFTNPLYPEITEPFYGTTIAGTQKNITLELRGTEVLTTWVTVSSEAPDGSQDPKQPVPSENEDIDNSGNLPVDAQLYRMRNLPTNGGPIYVTLWWLKDTNQVTNFEFRTFKYISAESVPVPSLLTPDPTKPDEVNSADLLFTWMPNDTVASGWWLYVSDNRGAGKGGGPGGTNVANSGFLSAETTEFQVNGLPYGTFHVRLWYLEGTTWRWIDYAFSNQAGEPPPSNGTGGATGPGGEIDKGEDNDGGL